jgi:hypothetical protein
MRSAAVFSNRYRMPRRLPERAAGGSRMSGHSLRRAKTRGSLAGERIAMRGAHVRTARRIARRAVRRSRPELLVRPDFIPRAVH